MKLWTIVQSYRNCGNLEILPKRRFSMSSLRLLDLGVSRLFYDFLKRRFFHSETVLFSLRSNFLETTSPVRWIFQNVLWSSRNVDFRHFHCETISVMSPPAGFPSHLSKLLQCSLVVSKHRFLSSLPWDGFSKLTHWGFSPVLNLPEYSMTFPKRQTCHFLPAMSFLECGMTSKRRFRFFHRWRISAMCHT